MEKWRTLILAVITVHWKGEPYQVQMTVGGDKLDYPYGMALPAA